jgi:hypothetical protein
MSARVAVGAAVAVAVVLVLALAPAATRAHAAPAGGAPRDREAEVNALLDAGKARDAQPLLDDWRAHGGEGDADYFIAAANVAHDLARTQTLDVPAVAPGTYTVGKKRADGVELEKRGRAVGTLRMVDGWDTEKFARATALLDEAIKRFPRRLDIAVGRAYLAREIHDLDGELAALRTFVANARVVREPLFGRRPLDAPVETFGAQMLETYVREHCAKQTVEDLHASQAIHALAVELYPTLPHAECKPRRRPKPRP